MSQQSDSLSETDVNVRLAIASWARAILAGLAQLGFCSQPLPGVLTALGLAAYSPWMLLGAVAGCAIGTAVERWGTGLDHKLWRDGIGGFNPAILGILGSGMFAARDPRISVLILLFALCAVLAAAMRKPMARVGLFGLSAPAYLTALGASLVLSGPESWWWTGVAPAETLGPAGIWITIAAVMAAITWESPGAAGWTVCSSLCACILVSLSGGQLAETVGLWGIVVPLSAFGAQRLLAWRSPAAPAIAMSAAAVSAAVWWLWHVLQFDRVAPPLVAPVILTLWGMMLARGWRSRWKPRSLPHPMLQRAFAIAVIELWRNRWAGHPVLLVTGPTQIEDAVLGGLFVEGDVRGSVIESRAGRRRVWEAADMLRRADKPAAPDFHPDLVLAGDCIGYEADLWKRFDGAGRADRMRCLDCGHVAPAPPAGLWRRLDLTCSHCSSPIVPDIRKLFPLEPEKARAELLAILPARAAGIVLPGALESPAGPALVELAAEAKWPIIQVLEQFAESLPNATAIVGEPRQILRLFHVLGCVRRRP
jgi:urea transporter